MAKGVNKDDTVSIREGRDKTATLPAFAAHQETVLQDDRGSFALNGVMNALAAMNHKRHFAPTQSFATR